MRHTLVVFGLIVFSLVRGGMAQHARDDCAASMSNESGSGSTFIKCAREGTARYQDRSAAILDGYRLIGRDFPGMGEHWINISLLFDSKFDPERPEVLNYVEVAGKPQLLGVAYALPLLAGESAPDWPGAGAWHAHYRTLNDESMSPEHHRHGEGPDGARIAMLHAWIWTENPAGTFAADNWAVPYIRLGLSPPEGASETAARALSLVSGGSDYFTAAIGRIATPSLENNRRIEIAFGNAETEVEALIRDGAESTLTTGDTRHLAEIWNRLWDIIDRSVSGASGLRLKELGFGSP